MSVPKPDNRNWIDRYLDNLRSLSEDAPDDYTQVNGVPIGISPRKLLDPPGFLGSVYNLTTKGVLDPIATPILAPTGAIIRAVGKLPDKRAKNAAGEEVQRAPFTDKPEIPFAGNDLDPAAYAEYARANLNESLPGQIAAGMLTPLSLFGGGFKALGTGLGRVGAESAIPALGKASQYGKMANALIEMDKTYTEGVDLISKGAGSVIKGPVRDFGKKVPLYGAAQEWALSPSPAAIRDKYTLAAAEVTNSLGRAVRARGRGLSSADVRTPGAPVVTSLPKGLNSWSVIGNTYTTINNRIMNMAPERQARALRVFGDMIDSTNAMQTRSVIERGQLLEEWERLKPTLSGQDLADAELEVTTRRREIFEAQAQAQHKDQLAILKTFEELDNTPIAKFGAMDPAVAAQVKQATATAVKSGKDAAIEARRYAAELRGKPRLDPITGLKITPEPIWNRPNWNDNIQALMGEDIPYREARQKAIDAINGATAASGLGSDDPMTAFARTIHGLHRQGLEGWDVSPLTQAQELGLGDARLPLFDQMLRDPKQFYDRAAREIPMARNSLMRKIEAGLTAHMKAAGKSQADIDAALPRLMRDSNVALSHDAFNTKNRLGFRTLTDEGKRLSQMAGRYDQFGDILRVEDMDNIIAGRMGEMFHREELGIKPLRRGIVVPGVGMTALDELQKLPGMGRLGAGLDQEWKQEAIGKLHQVFLDQGMTDLQAGAEAARLAASPRELLAHPAMKQLLFDDLKTGAGLALGSWKEQNLLAPAYHVANVTSQAALGTLAHAYGAEDVDPKFWLKLLRQKMTQLVKEGKADNSIPHAVSPDYVMIRGNGSTAQAWAGLADTVGEQAAIHGTETASSTGRIPTPIRLALFGGGMAGAAHQVAETAGLSDEDEAKLVGVAGLLGSLYGWKVPAGVKANFLLAGATEKGGRIAAGLTGFESNIGQIERDALTDAVTGTGQKKEFHDAVDTLMANLGGDLQSVGRQVTGPVPLAPGAPRPAPLRPPSAQGSLASTPKPSITPPEPVVGPVAPVAEATVVEPALGPPEATATFNTAEQSLDRRIEMLDTYINNVATGAERPDRADVLDKATRQRDRLVKQRDAMPTAAPAPEAAPRTTYTTTSGREIKHGEGWKIHVPASPENYDGIRAFLTRELGPESGGRWKMGQNSGQTGKDFTLYIGDRRETEALAAKMEREVGHLIDEVPADSDVRGDDTPIGKLWMRFDTGKGSGGIGPDGVGWGFNQYGPDGVPLLFEDVRQQSIQKMLKQPIDTAAAKQRAHEALTKEYGPYYTGVDEAAATEAIPAAATPVETPIIEAITPAAMTPYERQQELNAIYQQAEEFAAQHPDLAPFDKKIAAAEAKYQAALDAQFKYTGEKSLKNNPEYAALNKKQKLAYNALDRAKQARKSAERDLYFAEETRLRAERPELEGSTATSLADEPPEPGIQQELPEAVPEPMPQMVEPEPVVDATPPDAAEMPPPEPEPEAAPSTMLADLSVPYENQLETLFDIAVERGRLREAANPASQDAFNTLQTRADITRSSMADENRVVPLWFDNPNFEREVAAAVGGLDPTAPTYQQVRQQAIESVMKDWPAYDTEPGSGFAHPDNVVSQLINRVRFTDPTTFGDDLLTAADNIGLRLDPHLSPTFERDVQVLGYLKDMADQPIDWSLKDRYGLAPLPDQRPEMTDLIAMTPDQVNQWLPYLSDRDRSRFTTLWSGVEETNGRVVSDLRQAIIKAQEDFGIAIPGGAGGSGLPLFDQPPTGGPPGAGPPTGGPPAVGGPPAWSFSTPDPAFQIGDLKTSRQLKTARNLAYGDMPNAPDGIDLEDYFDLTKRGPKIKIGGRFDSTAFKRAFADANGRMTADEVYDLARSFGASRPQATRLRADWDDRGFAAERAGKANSDNIHIDYQDINNLIYYGKMGPFPFLTWQAKAIPKYLQMMAHHPAIPIAINEYTKATDNELEEQGLPPSFRNYAKDGGIISAIAQMAMQREGDVYANALPAFFPYSDVGKEQSDYQTPVDKVLDAARSVGLGPSPLITAPLNMLGLTSDLPINMLRNSPLLAGGVQALTGHAVDPEALPKQAMRGIRGAINPGSLEDTVTGDPIKDYYVRKRIASMAAEKGQKPTGQYLEAIQNGKGPIWDLALRDVEREAGGRSAISWVAPVRTRLVDTGEQAIREAQVEQGITSLALEELNRQPLTHQDMQYAAASLARNPLDMGETLEDRAKSLRVSRQFGKARAAAPVTGGLSGLGADPRSEARRAQLLEQESRRSKPLSARARASRERAELSRGEAILREMGK